jgi:hypothetical protein
LIYLLRITCAPIIKIPIYTLSCCFNFLEVRQGQYQPFNGDLVPCVSKSPGASPERETALQTDTGPVDGPRSIRKWDSPSPEYLLDSKSKVLTPCTEEELPVLWLQSRNALTLVVPYF